MDSIFWISIALVIGCIAWATYYIGRKLYEVHTAPSKGTRKKQARFNAWWPSLASETEMRKAANEGVLAAGFVVVVTTVLAALSIWNISLLGMTPWGLVDSAFFAVVGFGINKMSRVAAITGFALYVLEQGYRLSELQTSPSVGSFFIPALFALCFFNAIRATFAYHRLQHATSERLSGVA